MTSFKTNSMLNKRKSLAKKMVLPVLFCCVVGTSYMFRRSSHINSSERRLAYDVTTSSLPAWTSTYANVWDPILTSDTPTFWYEIKVRSRR